MNHESGQYEKLSNRQRWVRAETKKGLCRGIDLQRRSPSYQGDLRKMRSVYKTGLEKKETGAGSSYLPLVLVVP